MTFEEWWTGNEGRAVRRAAFGKPDAGVQVARAAWDAALDENASHSDEHTIEVLLPVQDLRHALAEVAALRAALREQVIEVAICGSTCGLCYDPEPHTALTQRAPHGEWAPGEPEHHAPGCLAAPEQQP